MQGDWARIWSQCDIPSVTACPQVALRFHITMQDGTQASCCWNYCNSTDYLAFYFSLFFILSFKNANHKWILNTAWKSHHASSRKSLCHSLMWLWYNFSLFKLTTPQIQSHFSHHFYFFKIALLTERPSASHQLTHTSVCICMQVLLPPATVRCSRSFHAPSLHN